MVETTIMARDVPLRYTCGCNMFTNDVSTAYLQNDHILKMWKTVYVVSIGDICLFFRSCLGPLVYLLPTLFELFRFLQGTYIVRKYHINLYQVEKRVFC